MYLDYSFGVVNECNLRRISFVFFSVHHVIVKPKTLRVFEILEIGSKSKGASNRFRGTTAIIATGGIRACSTNANTCFREIKSLRNQIGILGISN